jgi:transposase
MKGVDTIERVRREFFVRGRSLKEISRDLHVSRNTVRKIVRSGATAFEYERRVQPRPKIGPLQDELDELLAVNAARPARERLSWTRIYEELRGLGYEGGYDAVRRYASACSAVSKAGDSFRHITGSHSLGLISSGPIATAVRNPHI